MTRHTLKSLGPKVLATRMVRDYVRQLYTPAAATARALNSDYAGAAELAAWKKKVRAGWPGVRVEHVESSGVGDAPEVGDTMSVRAFVALGDLAPDGRRRPARARPQHRRGRARRHHRRVAARSPSPTRAAGTASTATCVLDRSGAFGYTVRVIPRNDLLASPAELGVVALP